MAYRVIITPPAERRLNNYIGYTLNQLSHPQAAKAIKMDAEKTIQMLSDIADVIKICDNPILAKHRYRKYKFLEHRFVILYRIDVDVVIIDGMFHELQDYEAIFISEMKLV